jgi:RES domain-containing protein
LIRAGVYRGKLYRALNPLYAREPFSGKGAERYGGRFNPRGTPALYCSLTALTALREANQVGNLQPTTLVSYEAEIEKVFDGRDEAALHAEGMDAAALADPTWRDQMKAGGEVRTQAFARAAIVKGYRALLVRSVAPGADESDLNLVLWVWGRSAQARLVLIDDEGRLSS